MPIAAANGSVTFSDRPVAPAGSAIANSSSFYPDRTRLPWRGQPSTGSIGARMAVTLQLRATAEGAVQTVWKTAGPQRGDEEVLIELDALRVVHEVAIGVGSDPLEFPGAVLIETSTDGAEWVQQWRSGSGGAAFQAALQNARHPMLRFQIGAVESRFIRVRELWSDPVNRWSISSISVRGGTANGGAGGPPVR